MNTPTRRSRIRSIIASEWARGTAAPVEIGNGATTTFSNPSATHKVWRHGENKTGTLELPIGYRNITWEIVQHGTGTVVKTGSGKSVNHTFNFLGTDQRNTYALIVHATKAGYPDLHFLMPGEITVLPAKFTEAQADLVIDLSAGGIGNKDGAWTARPNGYKVYVKGTTAGSSTLNFFWWNCTDPTKPLHVEFDNAQITSSTRMLALGSSKNVVFDGCINEATQYGLKLIKSNAGTGECFYMTPADNTHESSGWIIGGINIDGGSTTYGGSGFVLQMSNGTFNATNYTFDSFTLFNCNATNVGGEGYYKGHTRDSDVPAYSRISNAFYYRCHANTTKNEAFQIGAHDPGCEVFLCVWRNTGIPNEDGQKNIYQFADGNQGIAVYMNDGLSTHDMFQGFIGFTGTETEQWANIVETTGPGVNWLMRVDAGNGNANIYWGVWNNTLRAQTGTMFNFYKETGATSVMNPFLVDSNAVFTDVSTTHTVNNGFDATNLTINNKHFTDINDVLVFNAGSKNYKPATIESPLANFVRQTVAGTRKHRWADYRFDGYKENPANRFAGAYSGFDLMTGVSYSRSIASLAALTPIVDIPNGTAFNSLSLPAKVLATMSDGSTRMLSITWSSAGYNASTAGTYTVHGTLTLPADVTNPLNLTAAIDLTVLAGVTPVNFKVNFFTGAAAGWIATGSTNPSVTNVDVDFGQLGTTGVGIRAKNSTNKQWGGTGSSGGTGGVYPNAVSQTYWFTAQAAGNAPDLELYETTPGSLSGRLYTIKILCSRAGVATRTTRVTINGVSQDVNCGNNINTLLTFTHVPVVGGKIVITVAGVAPTDNNSGHINGMEVDSE